MLFQGPPLPLLHFYLCAARRNSGMSETRTQPGARVRSSRTGRRLGNPSLEPGISRVDWNEWICAVHGDMGAGVLGQQEKSVLEDCRKPYCLVPPGLPKGTDAPDSWKAQWISERGEWAAPSVMQFINAPVVRKSAALLDYGTPASLASPLFSLAFPLFSIPRMWRGSSSPALLLLFARAWKPFPRG